MTTADSPGYDQQQLRTEAKMDPIIPTRSDHDTVENNKFRFDPPLYIQRYDYIGAVVKQYKCTTLIDIGCAECKLLRYLKNNIQELNLMIGVDIDQSVLNQGNENLNSSWFDYIHTRENPLDIYLVRGDISKPCQYFIEQACYESIELDFVSMVEIIEHMYPDTLQGSIETVFGKLKPRIVVMTTPNSDFNVVFEDLEPVDSSVKRPKFRHWDHKFEWTRREFQDWCDLLLRKYDNYELVKYDGLGEAPSGYPNIGFCSQIAVFQKKQLNKAAQPVQIKRTPFQTYMSHKKKLNYTNRQRRQTGDTCLDVDPYFNKDLFSQPKDDYGGYELARCIQYPFETFEFENIEARNAALLPELSYLVNFITKPFKCCDYLRNNYNDYYSSDEEVSLTEEQKERIDNSLDMSSDEVRLCPVEKLITFTSIEKFKIPYEEIIDLMKSNNYEFTASNKYLIVREFNDSETSSNYDEYQSQLRSCSVESGNNDEESSSPVNSYFSEENWDDEMVTSTYQNNQERVFSEKEQFGNDSEDSAAEDNNDPPPLEEIPGKKDSFSEFSPASLTGISITSTHSSLVSSCNSILIDYEVNYYSCKARQWASKFVSIRRNLRHEEKKRSKKELNNNELLDLNGQFLND